MTDGAENWGRSARQLQAACSLLEAPTPENLCDCLKLLEETAHGWPAVDARADAPEALRKAEALRDLVRRVGDLLEGAAEYHRKWTSLVRSMTAGYSPGGQPGEYVAAGSLCMRG